MAVNFFKVGNCYRHCDEGASLDIYILRILHVSDDYVRLGVLYEHRHDGIVQYTGKGIDKLSDKIKIKVEDFKNWKLLNE